MLPTFLLTVVRVPSASLTPAALITGYSFLKLGQTALQGRQWQITVLQHIHCQIISTGLSSVRLLLMSKLLQIT